MFVELWALYESRVLPFFSLTIVSVEFEGLKWSDSENLERGGKWDNKGTNRACWKLIHIIHI